MIFVALGSNLGDREARLGEARLALEGFDITVVAASALIETPALLPPGAPAEWDIAYLNQVLRVETHLQPMDLLGCFKHIEAELGRKADAARWSPREIDIDLLAYGDEIVISDALMLPHPGIDSRAFVLKPLKEIAPEWRHPVLEKTPAEMLAELP